MTDGTPPHLALLEELVRAERARLVGGLVRWCGDLQLAEDGFADAVERAITTWADDPPRDPRAWLITVARNRIRDHLGSAERTRTQGLDAATPARTTGLQPQRDDDTLAVMFACAHPALDRGVHAPLILQVVLGVRVPDIATAFALPAATLAKRLVRAKQKLRANRTSFEVPEGVPPERVAAVLDAIYAAYAVEWLRVAPAGAVDLVTEEAIHASQLLLAALPRDYEVRGLAALLLFLHSRTRARIRDDMLVPLDEQDERLWDRGLIRLAERILGGRLADDGAAPPGPYELQAAIQAAHAVRGRGDAVSWPTVAHLHDALALVTPSKGAAVARAAAIARAADPAAALAVLDDLARKDPSFESFQPYHATRAALLAETSAPQGEYLSALTKAIDLCTHPPSRRYLTTLISRHSTSTGRGARWSSGSESGDPGQPVRRPD